MMNSLNARPKPLVATLKIWFAGLALGPVLIFFGTIIAALASGESIGDDLDDAGEILGGWVLMLLYGALFSFPSALLLWLALAIQYRFEQSAASFWATVLAITFTLAVAPFVVLFGLFSDGMKNLFFYGLCAAYVAAIWVGVWWAFKRLKTEPIGGAEEPLDANL